MIKVKQILGKIPRKHSNSKDSSPSSTSKKKGGNKRLNNVVDEVISAPLSALTIDKKLNVNLVSSAYAYEALPSLGDVPNSEKQQLFIRKVRMCCVQFDFMDPTKNLQEKQIKLQTLLELVEYMTNTNGMFSETVMQEIVKMVSENIFREFTHQPRDNELIDGVDLEEDEPAIDPAWPHLQVVYEFLLRFIASPETDAKIAKRHIDHSFVLKLLDLFDSEDPREREYLKTILHRIYGKFMVLRPFIRKSINNIFHEFVFETEKHNGIGEFLEVLGSIINGFALPLKEEHKLFLVRILIPLHKPKCLAMYHQQLCYCIMQFMEKDCKLADIIIRGLLKYWPVTNSAKEVLYLNEMEEVLEATQGPEFQRCMVPLFRQISRSLSSLHFQVAERALFLWKNDQVENLIRQNRKVILPIIFPAIEKNVGHHWNQAVHSLSINIRKLFFDLDPDLFKACQIKFKADELKEGEMEGKREAAWKLLEQVAAKKGTTTTATINLVP